MTHEVKDPSCSFAETTQLASKFLDFTDYERTTIFMPSCHEERKDAGPVFWSNGDSHLAGVDSKAKEDGLVTNKHARPFVHGEVPLTIFVIRESHDDIDGLYDGDEGLTHMRGNLGQQDIIDINMGRCVLVTSLWIEDSIVPRIGRR